MNFIAALLCFALALTLCIAQTILTKSMIVSAACALPCVVIGAVVYLTYDDLKADRHE